MNTIIGLLQKDLYVFKNYKGNIIFSFIIFTILIAISAIQMEVLTIGTITFLIFFGMNSISTFSYDENADSDKYLLGLPITKKEIVISKYLFTFLNSIISIIIGFIISLIITILVKGSINNLGSSIRISLIAFTSSSFLMCADIPCIYKWGVEKGRMQSVLVPVLIIFLTGLIGSAILLLFPNLYTLINLDKLFNISPLICLILNILFYYFSYRISYKIFKNKSL